MNGAQAAEAAYPADLQGRVDDYLAALRFNGDPGTARLDEAMRYSLLAGGKRIRPVLALATAEALGHDQDAALPLAAALEMIHTYSLIHDDLPAMDDDELRRGQPTCHVAFGEDVAILAGDGLFAEAIHLVLERTPAEPANVAAALRELTGAVGVRGMVGGQFLDVTATGELDGDALRRLHELKTGRLIAASVGSVLRLFGEREPATIAYGRFAAELGVLFQIVDDILDVTGDEAALGKPRGSDARHGRHTYVSVFGLGRARELAGASHAAALAALERARGETGRLRSVADYVLTRQN